MRFKRYFFAVVVSIVLLVSVFSAGMAFSAGRTEDEMGTSVLVYNKNAEEVKYDPDCRVVEEYDSYLLVETYDEKAQKLKQTGNVKILDDRYELHVKGHDFDLREGYPDFSDELMIESYGKGEEGIYLIHMLGPVHPEWREELETMGVDILDYVPNYAYEVYMNPEEAEDVEELDFVDCVDVYQPGFKLADDVEPGLVSITFSNGERAVIEVEREEELIGLANRNDVYYISQYQEPKLHGEVATQTIGGGHWIWDPDDDPYLPWRGDNDQYEYGAHVNHLGNEGDGVTVAVADTGIHQDHPDFQDRVIGGYDFTGSGDWTDGNGHGTHCAGSVAGDTYAGTGDTVDEHWNETEVEDYLVAQGMAPQSDLFSVRIFDDDGQSHIPEDTSEVVTVARENSDAYIHSNSWGSNARGAYDGPCSEYDSVVRDAGDGEPMVITVSAGNEGSTGDLGEGEPDYQTTGSPGNAKNVITVGASEAFYPGLAADTDGYEGDPERTAEFSSRGWAEDGRVKPDVMAPGMYTFSTYIDEDTGNWSYAGMGGTSMSNPAVAGAASVIVDWYEDQYGERPSPALVKALMINTAYDMEDQADDFYTGPIPNEDEGWGIVNLPDIIDPSVDLMYEDQDTIIETGDEQEYEIEPYSTDEPLKVSTVWTDAPAEDGADPTLKNDLNLEVETPTGEIIRGNAFDLSGDGESDDGYTYPDAEVLGNFDGSGDGWDDRNNVENVYINPDDLEEGTYTVRVIGEDIPDPVVGNGQDYALVVYNEGEAQPGPLPPTDPDPTDGAANLSTDVELSAYIEHEEGNDTDVEFYDASDDSLIGSESNVANGTRASTMWNGLDYGTTYEWYAVAEDDQGESAQSSTWSFTTMEEPGPSPPSDPEPADGATGVATSPSLSVYVEHDQGDPMDVSFYNASDDSLIDTDSNVGSGSRASVTWNGLGGDKVYEWYAVAEDSNGTSAESSTWSFTTMEKQGPFSPSDPEPADGATGVDTSPTLSVYVEHENGTEMDVSFYDASDDSLIGTDDNVASGDRATVLWQGLDDLTTYEWYTEAADDEGMSTQSATWSFETVFEPEEGAYELMGYFVESHDGEAKFFDGAEYYGNISVVEFENPDNVAINEDTDGSGSWQDPYGGFAWNAEGDDGWSDSPPDFGNNIYYVNEVPQADVTGEAAYVWSATREVDGDHVASPQESMVGQYEPLPTPIESSSGEDWIEIGVDSPAYTDWDNDAGESPGMGTYDEFVSYSVFVQGEEYEDWTHLGETESVPEDEYDGTYDDPIEPWNEDIDPESVTTGMNSFNASSLGPGEYQFMVRMNIGEGLSGGYAGGYDDAYTTWGSGAPSETMEIEGEQYTLDISVEGEGSIEVDGEAVETPYSEEYWEGTEVDLTAVPAENWEFDGWTGDVEDTTDQVTVTMDEDKSLTANFVNASVEHELSIDVAGEGSVEVDGEAVETPYTEQYTGGTEVDLTAVPAENWQFDGWTGDVEDSTDQITVTMDEDKSLTANFVNASVEHELSIDVEGEGSVEVDGQAVESPFSEAYPEGMTLDIEALPEGDWQFSHWIGDHPSEEREEALIEIEMDEDKSLTAYFEKVDTSVEHELTIDVEGEGTTDPEPGTHTYYDGKAVPITATPDDGWILDEWTGDIGGTEEDVTVVMDSDKSITAHFEEEEEPGEPYFEVTITSPEDGKEFEKGEEVIVEYEVENTGDAEDMQDLEFLVEDDLVETKEDVSLAPGDTDDGYFVWEADGEGEVNLVVRSINDEETVESTAQISITVEDEGGTGSVIESEVCSWWWLIPVLLIIIVLIIILLVTRRGEEEEEELPDEEPYGSPAPPPPTGRYESEDEFGEAPPSPEESEFVEKDEQAPPTDEGEFGEGSEEETFEDEGSYEEPGQGEEEPIEEDEEL